MNTVEALKELYKSFGGKLTDTYSTIADGIPVGNYTVIPDCFAALAEIAGGSIELPVVTQADAGDVLTVGEDGKWTNEEPAKELPTVTSEDEGDVLTVNAEGEWTNAEPAKELPSVTASDNGSVLSVVDGAWAKGLKIKKKTVTYTKSSGGTDTQIQIDVFTNTEYDKVIVLGYKLKRNNTPFMQTVYLSMSYSIGYGSYITRVVVDGRGSVLPAGDYEIEIYYIEQE